MSTPLIVGIGGTLSPNSSSEAALRVALSAAKEADADTELYCASDLDLPFYDPKSTYRAESARRLLESLRAADGVILSSPGYHGGISGLIKNAIDYTEDMAGDCRVYLSGIPVGCIGVAFGGQAAAGVLSSLRGIAHALRGYPTPYGATVIGGATVFRSGECVDAEVRERLRLVGAQVVEMARPLALATASSIADYGGEASATPVRTESGARVHVG